MPLPLPIGRRHYLLTRVAQRADMPRYMTQLAGRRKFLQLIDHDGNTTANEAEDASDREELHIRNGACQYNDPQRPRQAITPLTVKGTPISSAIPQGVQRETTLSNAELRLCQRTDHLSVLQFEGVAVQQA